VIGSSGQAGLDLLDSDSLHLESSFGALLLHEAAETSPVQQLEELVGQSGKDHG
jgi:hypothetical protein